MHTIYTFALRVFILAAMLYIVALQFCSGKTIPIKIAYERPHILTTQNATVAKTIVGINDLNFMKIVKTHNMLEMVTTSTFAYAQNSSTCAFHSLVRFLSILLKNTLQRITKQCNTE